MKLEFLGRGSAFNVREGNTSAYFIENHNLFLIDCGETVFERLSKKGLLKDIKEIYVLVSHMHSDHCGSLGSVGLYCQFVLNNKLKIVVPHHDIYIEQLRTLMTLFGNTDKAYEFIYDNELDNKFKAFSTVRYELTLHDYQLICYSFTFETENGGIFFSSDTRVLDNILHFIDTHEVIDKMYMEVTDLDVPKDIHLYVNKLIEGLDERYFSKIWIMHMRNDECKRRVLEAGFNVVNGYNWNEL